MKYFILAIGLFTTFNLKAQSEDSSLFQYRISIKEITSVGSAKLIQEPLFDLFETNPEYQEDLQTFVFESKKDVDTVNVKEALIATGFAEVTYFKKKKIK